MDINKINYVFCDLDGTLLQDDKTLSKKTIESIKELKENTSIKFGIATGRALTSLLPLLERHAILDYVDAVVANNGVDLYIPKNQMHKRKHMVNKAVIQRILTTYDAIEEVNICFHNPGIFYAQKVTKRVSNIIYINDIDVVFHPNHDKNYVQTPRVMLLFDHENRDMIEKIVKDVHIDGVRGMFSEKDIYEYVDEHVSKDIGIHDYVSSFQDTMEHVLVIGDSYNDLEMIKRCGVGIAMKNADVYVQSHSDYVSKYSNNEHGVAHILTSICKQQKKKERTI